MHAPSSSVLRAAVLCACFASPSATAHAIGLGRFDATLPRGCKIWNPQPHVHETITWEGSCKEGYVTGPGTAVWSQDGVATEQSSGTYDRGFLNGQGRWVVACVPGAMSPNRGYEGDHWLSLADGVGRQWDCSGGQNVGRFSGGSFTRTCRDEGSCTDGSPGIAALLFIGLLDPAVECVRRFPATLEAWRVAIREARDRTRDVVPDSIWDLPLVEEAARLPLAARDGPTRATCRKARAALRSDAIRAVVKVPVLLMTVDMHLRCLAHPELRSRHARAFEALIVRAGADPGLLDGTGEEKQRPHGEPPPDVEWCRAFLALELENPLLELRVSDEGLRRSIGFVPRSSP